MSFWLLCMLFLLISVCSCYSRRHPTPSQPHVVSDGYIVTTSPPQQMRGQPTAVVDGLVVPAWVAQEQQQQAQAQHMAKEAKMTATL